MKTTKFKETMIKIFILQYTKLRTLENFSVWIAYKLIKYIYKLIFCSKLNECKLWYRLLSGM